MLFNLPKPKANLDKKSMESDPNGYFIQAKKELLANPKDLLRKMTEYDKDNIGNKTIKKVKTLMNEDILSEKAVAKASLALQSITAWANAIVLYCSLDAQKKNFSTT